MQFFISAAWHVLAGNLCRRSLRVWSACIFVCLTVGVSRALSTDITNYSNLNHGQRSGIFFGAYMNISYVDPGTRELSYDGGEIGRYATDGLLTSVEGYVVHVRTASNHNHGCTEPINVLRTGQKWIALIKRGRCNFKWKIYNATKRSNASAVLIYDYHQKDELLLMEHSVANVVAVFIRKNDGERIAELADQGLQVKLQMHVVPHYNITYSGSHVIANQPAVLVLSILVSGTMVVFPLLLANCEKFSRY